MFQLKLSSLLLLWAIKKLCSFIIFLIPFNCLSSCLLHLHSDKESAINLITTGNVNEHYKYIDTKYRFICDHNEYIPTNQQSADEFTNEFTKPLSSIKLVLVLSLDHFVHYIIYCF